MVFSLGVTAFASGGTNYETITGEYRYYPALALLGGGDATYHFKYSDEYFTHSGYEYNHDLAIMTMDMAQSDGVSQDGGWDVSNQNFFDLMGKCGFENFDSNYYSTHEPTGDSIGVSIGTKSIVDNGRKYTLLVVGVRGHGYGNEWASDFTMGYEGDHQGFAEARDLTLAYIKDYIAQHKITGPIKIWMSGYSRSAITANMVGGKLDQGYNFGNGVKFNPDDLYCYTFETPQGVYDSHAHDALYCNIHNILNHNDLVPLVSFTEWGQTRYGVDYYLPCRQYDSEYYALKGQVDAKLDQLGWMNLLGLTLDTIDDFHYISLDPQTQLAKKNYTQIEFYPEAFAALFDTMSPTREYFVENMQADIQEVSKTLLGVDTNRLMNALAIFGQKFVALDSLRQLLSSLTIPGMISEGTVVDVIVDLFMESMQEAQCADYNGDQVRAALKNLVPKLLVLVEKYPDTVMTLLGNLVQILNAHFPEIGLTWMKVTPASFFEAQNPSNFFSDVAYASYYYDAVKWAYGKGIVKGYTATCFGPDDTCTRGQVASFLWRAAGCPEPKASTCKFVDVDPASPHYKAIIWASEKGITLGFDATHFRPDQQCTRAQIVTFIYRYEGSPKTSAKCPFVDVQNPYLKSVTWAAKEGITLGKDATHFEPNSPCTRAQVVTFLYRDMA